jgi:putative transposase
MNPPRCDDLDYIHFLIAAQRAFTCTEAARCQPGKPDASAHDAFTRLLRRSPPDMEALWKEAGAVVKLEGGVLVLDDTTRLWTSPTPGGWSWSPTTGAGGMAASSGA